jgi:hypothetical protein
MKKLGSKKPQKPIPRPGVRNIKWYDKKIYKIRNLHKFSYRSVIS